jgi:tetratricopeptide (TPR) repeat protein
VLAELTGAHLLAEHVPHRYVLHDLLRAYAEEQAHASDGADDRRAAVHRLLDHYVHSAFAADRLLDQVRDPIVPVQPSPGVTPERLGDGGPARAWFSAEHAVLLAATDRAVSAGFDAHAWQLAWSLVNFLERQGHWWDYVVTQRAALAAAERLGDIAAEALSHRHLARAYGFLRRFDEAQVELERAIELYGESEDWVSQGHSLLNLAWLREQQGRHEDGLEHARQALDLYVAAGHRRGQAMAFTTTGWHEAQLGAHRRALAACEQALPIFQELADVASEAATWDTIGYVHRHLGHQREAAASYRRSIARYRDLGDRYNEADSLVHLGDARHTAGDIGGARDAWRQALTILDEIAPSDADEVRARLRDLGPGLD